MTRQPRRSSRWGCFRFGLGRRGGRRRPGVEVLRRHHPGGFAVHDGLPGRVPGVGFPSGAGRGGRRLGVRARRVGGAVSRAPRRLERRDDLAQAEPQDFVRVAVAGDAPSLHQSRTVSALTLRWLATSAVVMRSVSDITRAPVSWDLHGEYPRTRRRIPYFFAKLYKLPRSSGPGRSPPPRWPAALPSGRRRRSGAGRQVEPRRDAHREGRTRARSPSW